MFTEGPPVLHLERIMHRRPPPQPTRIMPKWSAVLTPVLLQLSTELRGTSLQAWRLLTWQITQILYFKYIKYERISLRRWNYSNYAPNTPHWVYSVRAKVNKRTEVDWLLDWFLLSLELRSRMQTTWAFCWPATGTFSSDSGSGHLLAQHKSCYPQNQNPPKII